MAIRVITEGVRSAISVCLRLTRDRRSSLADHCSPWLPSNNSVRLDQVSCFIMVKEPVKDEKLRNPQAAKGYDVCAQQECGSQSVAKMVTQPESRALDAAMIVSRAPMSDTKQNGTTSLTKCERPVRPQTQFRYRK